MQHSLWQLLLELDWAFWQQAFWHFATVCSTSFSDLLLSHAHAEVYVVAVNTNNKTILSDMESIDFNKIINAKLSFLLKEAVFI